MGTSPNPVFWKLRAWGCLKLSLNSVRSQHCCDSWGGAQGRCGTSQSDELREIKRGFMAECLDFPVCQMGRVFPTELCGWKQDGAELSCPVLGDFLWMQEHLGTDHSQEARGVEAIKVPRCFGVHFSLGSCSLLGAPCSVLTSDPPQARGFDHGWCYNLDKLIYFTCKCPTIVFIT